MNVYAILGLVVATATSWDMAFADNFSIVIGAPLTLTGEFAQFGQDGLVNIEMWKEYVDSIGGIPVVDAANNKHKFFPHFVIADVGRDSFDDMRTSVFEVTTQMIEGYQGNPPVQVMLAPYTSTLTEVMTRITDEHKVLTVAHAASADSLYKCTQQMVVDGDCLNPNTRRFNYLFSTLSLASDAFRTVITLATTKQVETVAVIYEDDAFTTFEALGAVEEAKKNTLDVVLNMKVNRCEAESDAACLKQMKEVVDRLIVEDPDLVIAPTFPTGCKVLIKAMEEANYLPRAMALDACIGHAPTIADLKHDFDYFLGVQQWSEGLRGDLFTEDENSNIGMYVKTADTSSAQLYAKAYQKKTNGGRPSYQSASYMACLHTIHMALVLAKDPTNNTTLTNSMVEAITYSWQGSMYGQLAFNQYGASTKQYATTQNNYSSRLKLDVVTPLDSATKELIYPMPTWDERIYDPSVFASTSEKAVLVATVITSFAVVVIAFFVFRYRNATVMKAASPPLLLISLLGALLLVTSNLVWSLHSTRLQCILRPILTSFGFSLLFSPLFVKTFRLSRIFMSNNLSRINVTQRQMVLFVSVPLILDTLLLTVWFADSLPDVELDVDLIRPSLTFAYCSSEPVYAWLMISWKVAYAVLGAVLMFRSRKIPTFFNETQSISATIAAVLFCSVFVVPISALSSMPRELQFSLRSYGILIGVLATVTLLLLHKFALIHDRGMTFRPEDTDGSPHKTNVTYEMQKTLETGTIVKACQVCGELLRFSVPNSVNTGVVNSRMQPHPNVSNSD